MGETRYKTDVAMTPVYRAFYEDAAKIEEVAVERGFSNQETN
jgi:hypothetical protein